MSFFRSLKLWWLKRTLRRLEGARRRLRLAEIEQLEQAIAKRYGHVPTAQLIRNKFRTGGRNQHLAAAEYNRRKHAAA